jgi:energy-coupling factor transport system substrate-specific component
MLANITGTVSVNIIFFRLPLLPLAISLATAAFSGGIGGVFAYNLLRALRRYQITPES